MGASAASRSVGGAWPLRERIRKPQKNQGRRASTASTASRSRKQKGRLLPCRGPSAFCSSRARPELDVKTMWSRVQGALVAFASCVSSRVKQEETAGYMVRYSTRAGDSTPAGASSGGVVAPPVAMTRPAGLGCGYSSLRRRAGAAAARLARSPLPTSMGAAPWRPQRRVPGPWLPGGRRVGHARIPHESWRGLPVKKAEKRSCSWLVHGA